MKDTIVYIFDGLADWEIGLINYELRTVNQRAVAVQPNFRTGDPNHLQSMQYKDCLPE